MNAPKINSAPSLNSGPKMNSMPKMNSPSLPKMNSMPNTGSRSLDMPSMGSILSGWGGILLTVLVLVVLFAIYYKTIGYYIQIGWDKLKGARDAGERIDIKLPGMDVGAHLEPAPSGRSDSKPDSIVAGLAGAVDRLESDVESALSDLGGPGGKQVFNVSRNVYTYEEAEPLCRAFGAELATYDQVKSAYEAGADWCNYGWVKGQMAVYPTQKETYEKLQRGPADERMSCGVPGVNGGHFPNADQRFGVNCYGERPVESALDERLQMEERADTSYDRKVNEFKAERGSIAVTPWNKKQWSY